MVFSAILYVYHAKAKEELYEKILMYGFASFWLSLSILKFFFFTLDYLLEGTYTGDIITIIESYDELSYILLYFYLYLYSYVLVNILFLISIFIWFSIKSDKEFQSISSLVTIGFSFVLIGWLFEAIAIKKAGLFIPFLPPVFFIIGIFIATFPLLINLEFFSKSLANWLVIILVAGVIIFIGLTIFTTLPLFIISQIIIWTSSLILIIVAMYLIITYIKKRDRLSNTTSLIERGELKDTIKIFTKPATITIEEVQLYREKGLCLVCKGKIEGINYICPKCNALYCLKCLDVLENLENECWVCETTFKRSQMRGEREGK